MPGLHILQLKQMNNALTNVWGCENNNDLQHVKRISYNVGANDLKSGESNFNVLSKQEDGRSDDPYVM